MIDPNKYEIEAMDYARKMAGEYLGSLGKTDLQTFTKEEAEQLVSVIVGCFTEKLAELAATLEAR